MSMSFGPELLTVISREFNRRVLPSRVYRIETGEVWAALRMGGGEWLFISWHAENYGLGIIADETVDALRRTRGTRSSFGEALKKNLLNASLCSAVQLFNDRILELRFDRVVGAGFSVESSLLFEGTGRNSNLILIDDEKTVLDAAKHIHADVNRYRTVLPGLPYTPPPPLKGEPWSDDTLLASADEVWKLKGVGRTLVEALTRTFLGLCPSRLNAALRALFDEGDPPSPILLQRIGKYITAFPVPLLDAVPINGDLLRYCGKEASSVLFSAHRKKELVAVGKALEREIKSRRRHIDGLENQVSLSERGEEFRKYGELLLTSLHLVPRGCKEVSLVDYESGKNVVIGLDEKLSPAANAEKYFKKYRKSKIDLEAVHKRITALSRGVAELEDQMDALESIEDTGLLAEAIKDTLDWLTPSKKGRSGRKKEKFPPHIRFSHAGCEFYVGLNARGNRHVTFRVASPEDLWFHVHEIPGAHVIVKRIDGREDYTEAVILLAASLAAWFSKARLSTKAQVDYTERKYVRSVPGGAIALVTYTNPRTVQVSPDLWRESPEAVRSVLPAEGR
ncbi:MAG: fibronectin-binding domain-containing protein [Synergistaceae bacterium]|nr:fibronectin-binding domain-containing protein [Synergistaceae bacterium]